MKKVPFQDQIIHHLSGALSPKEEAEFMQMLEGNVERKEEYEMMKKIWEDSLLYDESVQVPEINSAWQKFEDKAFEGEKTRLVILRPWKKWMGVAAGVLILALAIFWLNDGFEGGHQDLVNAVLTNESLEVQQIELPDGSKVWLEQGATLSYDQPFKDRLVSLDGKAYFEVTHLSNDANFKVIDGKHFAI